MLSGLCSYLEFIVGVLKSYRAFMPFLDGCHRQKKVIVQENAKEGRPGQTISLLVKYTKKSKEAE
jgi:hypothetical protein